MFLFNPQFFNSRCFQYPWSSLTTLSTLIFVFPTLGEVHFKPSLCKSRFWQTDLTSALSWSCTISKSRFKLYFFSHMFFKLVAQGGEIIYLYYCHLNWRSNILFDKAFVTPSSNAGVFYPFPWSITLWGLKRLNLDWNLIWCPGFQMVPIHDSILIHASTFPPSQM